MKRTFFQTRKDDKFTCDEMQLTYNFSIKAEQGLYEVEVIDSGPSIKKIVIQGYDRVFIKNNDETFYFVEKLNKSEEDEFIN